MTGSDLAGFGRNAGITAGVALAILSLVWVIGARIDKHRIVDVVWGPGFAVIGAVSLALSAGGGDLGRRLLVTAMVIVWGLRLGVHIGLRGRGHGEDPRYEALLDKATGSRAAYAYAHVYAPQAAIMWFVSLPVQAAMYERPALSFYAVLPIAVWLLGLGFEAGGDAQLTRFAADPANRGRVMDRGLWHYTRHPNYFGDACVWWGIYLVGVTHWLGAATVLSPVVMTWLLARGTGKPLLEKRMASSRAGYADYVDRTSGFVPLPPRRARRHAGQ
ncbi:MAG: DUF1295 domain-containing protein [Mycobacteriales bacterium]